MILHHTEGGLRSSNSQVILIWHLFPLSQEILSKYLVIPFLWIGVYEKVWLYSGYRISNSYDKMCRCPRHNPFFAGIAYKSACQKRGYVRYWNACGLLLKVLFVFEWVLLQIIVHPPAVAPPSAIWKWAGWTGTCTTLPSQTHQWPLINFFILWDALNI